AGRLAEAEQQFTQVIEAGTTDPRVYYFRALSRMRTGRPYEAAEDLRIGSVYEARDPGAASVISQALVRIQGPERQKIEQYRRYARVERAEQMQQVQRARYEQQQTREQQVLRRETPFDLQQLAEPNSNMVPPAGAAAAPPTGAEAQPGLAGEAPA